MHSTGHVPLALNVLVDDDDDQWDCVNISLMGHSQFTILRMS